MCGFFSVVNTTVLYDPWIVESTDANHIYEGNADTKELRVYIYGGPTISYMQIFSCIKC